MKLETKEKLFRALEMIMMAIFLLSIVAIAVINYVVMYKEIGMITDLAFFPHWSMLIPLGTGVTSLGGWFAVAINRPVNNRIV